MDQIIKYSPKPSALLNSLFMATVNTASKTLMSVASTSTTSGGTQKWGIADHARYLVMLSSWFTMWALRVLMDHLPFSFVTSPHYFLSGGGLLALGFPGSSSSQPTSSALVVQDQFDEPSGKAIGRALTHIFGMLNDLPVNSRNYQFAISMAESIVNENMRDGDVAIQEINRSALSSGFSRTTNLLLQSLQSSHDVGGTNTWPTRLLYSLPVFGSYIKSIKSFINLLPIGNNNTNMQKNSRDEFNYESVKVEKYAQELLWITKKLKYSGAIDEAIIQWSFAYDLATASLTAKPRVQSIIVLISAILVRELARGEIQVHSQVKFRLLMLWIPLFCYANGGVAHPILSGIEKAEMERALEVVIPTLPISDQEILLTNWLQDFVYSNSDWPNLQRAYDRWCRTSRKNMMDGAEQLDSSIYKPMYT